MSRAPAGEPTGQHTAWPTGQAARLPSPAAVRELRDAVRGALLVEAGRETTWRPGPGIDPADLLAAVDRHRVAPLLATYADHLGLPAALADPLRQRRDRVRLLAMNVVHQTRLVQEALEGAGLRWLAFKGPALAALTTGDYTARGAGDVDVLVAPEDVPAAWRALVDAGWRHHERRPAPGPSWAWRHHLATHYELPMLADAGVVDLHWSLHPARGVLPDFDRCHARRTDVAIGPLSIPTLGPDDALAHSCAHASRDQFRWLRSLVDVHRLLRTGRPCDDAMTGAALAVTADAVGLPPGVALPAPAGRRVAVHLARKAQERPVPVRGTDLPGTGLALAVRRGARGSGPAEHARVAWGLLMSPAVGADVADESARTAVPRIAGRQVQHGARRLSGWMQR